MAKKPPFPPKKMGDKKKPMPFKKGGKVKC